MSYFVLPPKQPYTTQQHHPLNNTFNDKYTAANNNNTQSFNHNTTFDSITQQLGNTTLGKTYLRNSISNIANTYTQRNNNNNNTILSSFNNNKRNNISNSPYTTVQQSSLTSSKQQSKSFKHKPSKFKVNRYNNDGFFGPELKLDSTAQRAMERQAKREAENAMFNSNKNSSKSDSSNKLTNKSNSSLNNNKASIYGIAQSINNKNKKSTNKSSKPVNPVIKPRNTVLQFLTSPTCKLFSEATELVAVSDNEIDELISSNGGSDNIQFIVDRLVDINNNNIRCNNWNELCNHVNTSLQSPSNTQKVYHEQHNQNTDLLNLDTSRPTTTINTNIHQQQQSTTETQQQSLQQPDISFTVHNNNNDSTTIPVQSDKQQQSDDPTYEQSFEQSYTDDSFIQ